MGEARRGTGNVVARRSEWVLDETVETEAGRVAAARFGEGPDLVLAHGWPWSSYSYHRLVPALSRTHRVHVYDMPGFGRSEKDPHAPTGIDVQGRVFVEMLAHFGLERPRVVAHDFGGAVTLRAHLLHGAEFERALLMNVVAMRPWGSAFFDHVGRHTEAFFGLPDAIHRAVVEAYIKGALVNPLAPEDLAALVEPWLGEEGRVSFYRQFAQADERFTAEVEPHFAAMRCPVAIVWGEDDPWIPLERGRALHAAMPSASFETLPGVGHMPQLEAPDLALARIEAFLA